MRATVLSIVAAAVLTTMAVGPGSTASAAERPTGGYRYQSGYPTTTASVSPVQAVLTQINKVRGANGAKALTLDTQLNAAAHQHNLTMAGGCGLSHRCSGEGNAGARISAQGLKWNAWAENIGYGSTSAATDAAHAATATRITQSMIDEVAPYDGHRRNILNPSLGRIGIDLYRDAKGTLWMTQDFSN